MAGSAALALAPVPKWWPFRNQVLLTVAAMKAASLGVEQLPIGSSPLTGSMPMGKGIHPRHQPRVFPPRRRPRRRSAGDYINR